MSLLFAGVFSAVYPGEKVLVLLKSSDCKGRRELEGFVCEKNGHSARWSFALNLALSYLAGAKSEALDNMYSLLKQNIKSCNA